VSSKDIAARCLSGDAGYWSVWLCLNVNSSRIEGISEDRSGLSDRPNQPATAGGSHGDDRGAGLRAVRPRRTVCRPWWSRWRIASAMDSGATPTQLWVLLPML
jgi:hypothetical protein